MAANDIITDTGSFRQLYDIMGGIERAIAAIDPALNEGIGTGHRHLIVTGFAAPCVSCVHAAASAADAVFIDSAVSNRAVDDGHAAVIGRTRLGVTAVNTASHGTLRDGHLATRVIIDSASLTFFRKARVNILWSRNIREGNLIACGVAIFGIACVQIAGECRFAGKDYLVARSVSGCRLTASDFA